MEYPGQPPAPTRGPTTNARRGAVVAGIALAVASLFISLGASVIAMVAIWIAWAVYRRRGRPLTRGVSWLVGFGAVGTVVLAVFAVVVLTQLPKGTIANVKRSMDSAAAAPQPPRPEWLRKITPPAAQQQSRMAESLTRSSAFATWTAVMGFTLMIAMLAAYAGTLGWAASMLLAYGVTGDWFPMAPTDPSLLTAPTTDPLRQRARRSPGAEDAS